ncbi:MAG: hypothetical protein Q8M40_07155 [Legionella sp.]|nr:hypothetical protein [Legionella sp.]
MAKIERFLTCYKFQDANGKITYQNNKQFKISDFAVLKNKIIQAIKINDTSSLANLLKEPFIKARIINVHEKVTKDNNSIQFVYMGVNSQYITHREGVKTISIYQDHYVYSNLELLLRDHRNEFISIYQGASDACKEILTDFSNLDLRNLNFDNLELTHAKLTNTNLLGATNLSQDKLNECIKSDNAQLPDGLISSWNEHKKVQITTYIDKLKRYGLELEKSKDIKGKTKGLQAISLANQLQEQISSPKLKLNGQFQSDFMKTLEKYKDSFKERRFHSLKMIVANIALCVLGCGVGYVAAGAVHYMKTGSFAFFNRPTSYDKYLQIAEAAEPKGLSK